MKIMITKDLLRIILNGVEVFYIEGYAVGDYISLHYPEVILLPVKTLEEGLLQISLGTKRLHDC